MNDKRAGRIDDDPRLAYPGAAMKIAKVLLYALVILGALAAFGWFFASQLSSGGQSADGLAGVLVSAPPGYAVTERGELSPAAAAEVLAAEARRPGAGKVGVHFTWRGSRIYWLADVTGDVLEERAARPSGTVLQTLWNGGLQQRLAWARTHGDFSAPGLPPPQRKNLYH